jgi:hypothetical protein
MCQFGLEGGKCNENGTRPGQPPKRLGKVLLEERVSRTCFFLGAVVRVQVDLSRLLADHQVVRELAAVSLQRRRMRIVRLSAHFAQHNHRQKAYLRAHAGLEEGAQKRLGVCSGRNLHIAIIQPNT